MKLKSNETEVVGEWIYKDGKMVTDENCKRIESLTNGYLKKINSIDGGWTTNYQDPEDERYWQLTYPNSYMHGGGPPMLRCIESLD